MLSATELAAQLGVSKARVSQYVAQGTLDGCYEGEGRSRRFDPDRVRAVLQRKLDPGQMLGNGAKTKQALKAMPSESVIRSIVGAPAAPSGPTDGGLSPLDLDRYELARIQGAEEDARRKRRDNQRDEGRWVLATEVERQVARVVAQEVAEFEMVLREGARTVADRLGVDFKAVRQIMIEQWREHRRRRAAVLDEEAGSTEMTDDEIGDDI